MPHMLLPNQQEQAHIHVGSVTIAALDYLVQTLTYQMEILGHPNAELPAKHWVSFIS